MLSEPVDIFMNSSELTYNEHYDLMNYSKTQKYCEWIVLLFNQLLSTCVPVQDCSTEHIFLVPFFSPVLDGWCIRDTITLHCSTAYLMTVFLIQFHLVIVYPFGPPLWCMTVCEGFRFKYCFSSGHKKGSAIPVYAGLLFACPLCLSPIWFPSLSAVQLRDSFGQPFVGLWVAEWYACHGRGSGYILNVPDFWILFG